VARAIHQESTTVSAGLNLTLRGNVVSRWVPQPSLPIDALRCTVRSFGLSVDLLGLQDDTDNSVVQDGRRAKTTAKTAEL